jgi:hypothetical protein
MFVGESKISFVAQHTTCHLRSTSPIIIWAVWVKSLLFTHWHRPSIRGNWRGHYRHSGCPCNAHAVCWWPKTYNQQALPDAADANRLQNYATRRSCSTVNVEKSEVVNCFDSQANAHKPCVKLSTVLLKWPTKTPLDILACSSLAVAVWQKQPITCWLFEGKAVCAGAWVARQAAHSLVADQVTCDTHEHVCKSDLGE